MFLTVLKEFELVLVDIFIYIIFYFFFQFNKIDIGNILLPLIYLPDDLLIIFQNLLKLPTPFHRRFTSRALFPLHHYTPIPILLFHSQIHFQRFQLKNMSTVQLVENSGGGILISEKNRENGVCGVADSTDLETRFWAEGETGVAAREWFGTGERTRGDKADFWTR